MTMCGRDFAKRWFAMMNRFTSWVFRSQREQDEVRALAYEQARFGEAPPSETDVITRIAGREPIPMFTTPDGTAVGVHAGILAGHGAVFGKTGSGKSRSAAHLLKQKIRRAIRRLLADREKEGEILPLDLLVVDVKSDTAIFIQQMLAAEYLRGSVRLRRAITRSVHAMGWTRTYITPMPMMVPRPDISIAYQAEVTTDLIVRTSRQEWEESQRFLLFELLRVFGEIKITPTPAKLRHVLTDRERRGELVDAVDSLDLRDFLRDFDDTTHPQTVAALLRRLAREFAYPELLYAISIPLDEVRRLGVPLQAPVVIADCGSAGLPPEIGRMRANTIISDFLFEAQRRDPATEATVFIEEASTLLSVDPGLAARVGDGLRLLRARNVSLVLASQSIETFPKPLLTEVLTNTSWLIAFQSRRDVADLLYPHVLARREDQHLSPRIRREQFERQLANLRRQEAVFWAKGEPALRVRAIDIPEPSDEIGLPAVELQAIFDTEIAAASRIPIEQARRLVESSEVPPFRTPTPSTAPRRFLDTEDDDV